MFHSGCSSSASDFYQFDFPTAANISTVIFVNRRDCCTNRPYDGGFFLSLRTSADVEDERFNFRGLGTAAAAGAAVIVRNFGAPSLAPLYPRLGDPNQLNYR